MIKKLTAVILSTALITAISANPNIIILIGDGMGLAQISAYNYHNDNATVFEKFENIGLVKTHASDNLITDSAASATAINSGIKTNNGYIGIDANGKSVANILDKVQRLGYQTAIITTSSIVHATPAAVYAKVESRKNYRQIAEQLAEAKINYFIGGGKQYFTEAGKENLLEKMQNYYFAKNLNDFDNNASNYKAMFIADAEPKSIVDGRKPALAQQMTSVFNSLNQQKNQQKTKQKAKQKPVFMLVEAAQIDWAAHNADTKYFLQELQEFSAAINTAIDFVKTNNNSLLIVTADHETGGLTLVNKWGSSIIGAINGKIIKPATGKLKDKKLFTAYSTGGHSATMVPLFAMGYNAQLFNGVYDNTKIYSKIIKTINK